MTIRNIDELSEYFGTTTDKIERAIYKGTDCGAWIVWNNTEVKIGSIVEGSDAEFDRSFKYPFDSSEVDNWLEELEQLTTQAWEEANCDDPIEFIINKTNPFEEYTLADAEKILADAEATGWTLPSWFTAQEFLELYKDCNGEE